MVGFGIRMKGLGCLDRLGMFFFFTICALGLIPIVIADERHLLPPPSFVHSPALLLTASTAVAIPSISPLMRLADLSLRSPAITLSLSNYPGVQQHPPCGTSSPIPVTVMVQVQANDAASPSAAERWSPLRRTLLAKGVSPTPSSEPEPARNDQTASASPDTVDESQPLPMTGRCRW